MNLEKIKDYVLANKKYFLIGLGVLVIFFFWRQDSKQQEAALSEQRTVKKKPLQKKEETANSSEVTCDISGAVNNQGVYTLKKGARLGDLIAAAGGLKHNAQLKAINQALLLKDQDKVHIPYKGEKIESASATGSTASTSTNSAGADDKVNLNTADKAGLQKLTGIGEKKAEQIIAYRQEKGSFKQIEDLKEVSGIGDKTFASLKDKITV